MYIVEFRPNVYSLWLLVGMCMSPYMRHGPIQEMQYVSVRLPYPDTEGPEGGAWGTVRAVRGRLLGRRARRSQHSRLTYVF